MISWATIGPSVTAAFAGSFVEFVEALTIVLAVGTARGWRPALLGAAGGALFLAALVAALGPAIALIPIAVVQIVVGTLLLIFGLRWLRKAVLRAAGMIPLHDEAAIYAKESAALSGTGPRRTIGWDTVAAATSFKAVVLEGLEVVFIVIAVGAAGNMLVPASIGAAAAGLLVLLLGLAVRTPLARVPENSFKFAVGVILTAFGTFWLGEGLGLRWPGEDSAIIALGLAVLAAALVTVRLLRQQAVRPGIR
jgi:uncharacterized membrane protein